ncbi:hypothetical protein FOH38_09760 [Lysinibacillus fusiformis]|nr:hypothetical protein FOH38_09760 [Lysinibacillus fusiformis]
MKTEKETVEQRWSEYADWDGEVSSTLAVTIKNTLSKPILIQGHLRKYQLSTNPDVKNVYSQSASLSITEVANTGKNRIGARLKLGKSRKS